MFSCFGSNCGDSGIRTWKYENLYPEYKNEYIQLVKEYDRLNNPHSNPQSTSQTFREFLKAKDKLTQQKFDEDYKKKMEQYNDEIYYYVREPNPTSSPVKPIRRISDYISYADLDVPDGTPIYGGKSHTNYKRSHKRFKFKKIKKSKKIKKNQKNK